MRWLGALVVVVLGACGDAAPREPAPTALPRGIVVPRLDDPAHDLAVLDAEIRDWIRRAANDPSVTDAVIARLLQRAAIYGRLDDHVAADDVSRAWVERTPDAAGAHLSRARVHARLHRWAEARASLDAARGAGALPGAIEPIAMAIDQATGSADAAVAYHRARVAIEASTPNLVDEALALADAGRFEPALETMSLAVSRFRGTSAIAFGALLFQWGRIYEEAGETARARDVYLVAHDVLPQHVETTAHLAGTLARTGDRDAALALYEELIATERRPEWLGELATLLVDTDEARADALAAEARAGWQRWLAALPEAYTHHAQRFYLAYGR